jgi:hypothetical protein
MDRLVGQELLDALKNLEGAEQASMLAELGYLDNKGKPDFIAFSKALVLAKASAPSAQVDTSQQASSTKPKVWFGPEDPADRTYGHELGIYQLNDVQISSIKQLLANGSGDNLAESLSASEWLEDDALETGGVPGFAQLRSLAEWRVSGPDLKSYQLFYTSEESAIESLDSAKCEQQINFDDVYEPNAGYSYIAWKRGLKWGAMEGKLSRRGIYGGDIEINRGSINGIGSVVTEIIYNGKTISKDWPEDEIEDISGLKFFLIDGQGVVTEIAT